MAEMLPGFTVVMTIQRPRMQVFRAVVDPEQLSTYFTKAASGLLEAGAKVEWSWMGGERATVTVDEVVENERIVFHWPANNVGYETRVEMMFAGKGEATVVTISESGWKNDAEGLKSSYDHCGGWQHMLLCMKARLVHGIDLRV